MIELRPYQNEAIGSLLNFMDDIDGHPVVAIPTGAGKTFVICGFIEALLEAIPKIKILIVTHTKQIILQDYLALQKWNLNAELGIYSAGLARRENAQITVAGIQSIYNKIDEFFPDIIIVDECHMIDLNNGIMYKSLINKAKEINENIIIIGLTATPFRMGTGIITDPIEGEKIFTDFAYNLTSLENYNKLINDGYLAPLITKETEYTMNPDNDGVKLSGAEYNEKSLSDHYDREEITEIIVKEVIKYGKNYKKWLFFAIDIEHANSIEVCLRVNGIKAKAVHSKLPNSQSQNIINDFKSEKLRALINIDMLTIGFDAPDIDLIAILRPTKSPVRHVQSAGRGSRTFPGKKHCLLLDFAGNTSRLGPINDIQIKKNKKSKLTIEAPTKTCPQCKIIHHASVRKCEYCGYDFPINHGLNILPDNSAPIRNSNILTTQWLNVSNVFYSIHNKKGSPNSLRVTYKVGLRNYSEWITYDHSGYARQKARFWVKSRLKNRLEMPKDVQELFYMARSGFLKNTKKIKVREGGNLKYPEIVDTYLA